MDRLSTPEQARRRAGAWATQTGRHGLVSHVATEVNGTFVVRFIAGPGRAQDLLVDPDGAVTAYPSGAAAERIVGIHQAQRARAPG